MTKDVPSLFGEEYLLALLLRMVLEHCTTMKEGELKSFMLESNADAIRALSDCGFVQITESDGHQVRAIILSEASALASRFAAERDSEPR